MNMEEQTKKRGGKREGAGRKKFTCKRYGFNAPEDVALILESIGNKSDFICSAIRAFHKSTRG
jgi:hypothetical protein